MEYKVTIEIKSGKITRFWLTISIYPKGLYIVQETIYIGFKAKYKPYFLVRLGPNYFLKLDFLFGTIRTFLIIDIVTVATPTAAALSLIALLSVTKTAGFAFK